MYTNGLNYWVTKIKESEVDPPFIVSDIRISRNNKTIIAYYSVAGTD